MVHPCLGCLRHLRPRRSSRRACVPVVVLLLQLHRRSGRRSSRDRADRAAGPDHPTHRRHRLPLHRIHAEAPLDELRFHAERGYFGSDFLEGVTHFPPEYAEVDRVLDEATKWYKEMQKCACRDSVDVYRKRATNWLRDHP